MGKTSIEWTDKTWNPIRARFKEPIERPDPADKALKILVRPWGYHCEHIAEGCRNCYAEAMNGRMLPAWGTGLKYNRPNRDKVDIFLDETELMRPLRWRKPSGIFPCSMTDLFAEFVPDEFIDRMFAVMALTPQHRYIVLTKRGQRMAEYFADIGYRQEVIGIMAELWSGLDRHYDGPGTTPGYGVTWRLPFPNVILCVSGSTQHDIDEQVPHLLRTPAACRGLSLEPQIEDVDLERLCGNTLNALDGIDYEQISGPPIAKLDWVVQGGESGHVARPFNLAWARHTRDQCKAAGVSYFLKQLGRRIIGDYDGYGVDRYIFPDMSEWAPPILGANAFKRPPQAIGFKTYDGKGGDPEQWPKDLRDCRSFPEVAAHE